MPLKLFFYRLLAGANCAVVLLMWLCASSYYINPVNHPYLACLGLLFPFFLAANLFFLIFWLIFRIRYSLITLIGTLCCFGAIVRYVPLNWPQKTPEGCVKILSFNVQGYINAEQDDEYVNSLVKYLVESKADIICLQESNTEVKELQTKIDSRLGKEYPYQSRDFGDKMAKTDRKCYSKYPIISAANITGVGSFNGSVGYEVKLPNDTLLIINNHLESNRFTTQDREGFKDLSVSPSKHRLKWGLRTMLNKVSAGAAIRVAQCDTIRQFVEQSGRNTVVICGDFNDSPLSYTLYKMSEGMLDAFIESGCGLGLSFDEQGIHVRIDHILHSKNLKSHKTLVDNRIKESDHYPIITHLKRED